MSENGKSWLRRRWRLLLLLIAGSIVGWSAYSYWSEYSERAAQKARQLMAPSVGANCTIVRGSDVAPVSGYFVKLNDDWIVLGTSGNKQIWVPRDEVTLMRVEP